jgi:Na+/H+ antiporter NhaB
MSCHSPALIWPSFPIVSRCEIAPSSTQVKISMLIRLYIYYKSGLFLMKEMQSQITSKLILTRVKIQSTVNSCPFSNTADFTSAFWRICIGAFASGPAINLYIYYKSGLFLMKEMQSQITSKLILTRVKIQTNFNCINR